MFGGAQRGTSEMIAIDISGLGCGGVPISPKVKGWIFHDNVFFFIGYRRVERGVVLLP